MSITRGLKKGHLNLRFEKRAQSAAAFFELALRLAPQEFVVNQLMFPNAMKSFGGIFSRRRC